MVEAAHSHTEVAGRDHRNDALLPGNIHGEVDTDDENAVVDLLVEHPVDIVVVHSNNHIPREAAEAVVVQLHVNASSIHPQKQKLLPHHARIEHAYPVPNSSSSRQPY